MPLTIEQILAEISEWPIEKIAELRDRLEEQIQRKTEPEISPEWRAEIQRRIAEMDAGTMEYLSEEEVEAKARKILGPGPQDP